MARRSAGFVSKKAHRKSRGGCFTCKRKRVKCDEAQPACGYCLLRKFDCEYLQDQVSASKSQSPASSSDHTTPPSETNGVEEVDFSDTAVQIPTWLVPPALASSGQLTFLEHALLHHYKTSTWKTFAVRQDTVIDTLHRDIIPQSSLSHSYLLYALLGLAASHINALSPDKQIEKQALVYRQKTFQEYGKALQNITSESYETVLMTGALLLALIPPPAPERNDEEHLEWMNTFFKMSGGIRVLASLRWAQGIEKLSIYPLICRQLRTLPPPPTIHRKDGEALYPPIGPLGTTPDHPNPAPTYQHQHPHSNPVFLPPSLMALLENLVSPLPSSGPIDLDKNDLAPVLYALSPIFTSLYYYHLNQDFYVRWTVFASFLTPEFLHLVKAREPRALTLVAWWFALADLVPKGYWTDRYVVVIVGVIGRVVRGQERGTGGVYDAALQDAERIARVFESEGREEAAKSVFERWEGATWAEGPKRAEEWECEQQLNLANLEVTGFDCPDLGFKV